jgi:hypothetical protein
MNVNVNKIFKKTINQRLSTEEMENSQTKCGLKIKITLMFFDDHKPNFPSMIIGRIYIDQKQERIAKWNQYGECTVNSRRAKTFDLITPPQKKID